MSRWTVDENGEEIRKNNVYVVDVVKSFVVEAPDIDSAILMYREGIHQGCFNSEIINVYKDYDGSEDDDDEGEEEFEE